MAFKDWLFNNENILESLFPFSRILYYFNENQDRDYYYRRRGYRKIRSKFGKYKGKWIYWHPYTKDVVPVEPEEGDESIEPKQQPDNPYVASRDIQQRSLSDKPTQNQNFITGNTWALALSLDIPGIAKGTPIVISKTSSGWKWQTEDGRQGTIPFNDPKIRDRIRSIRDEKNNPVVDTDPQNLFSLYKEKYTNVDINTLPDLLNIDSGQEEKDSEPDDEESQSTEVPVNRRRMFSRPNPSEVRIAPERMTEYNVKIEKLFLETNNNIMIDALAGTGKTTMLKHLSSYIRPGERWLYLVFNKRNQVESQNNFPEGVDVMTTHAFLGQLLKANGLHVGGNTKLPAGNWRKLWKIVDSVVPKSWPESELNFITRRGENVSPFHWKAKLLVSKIVSLAKSYAITPDDSKCKQKIEELIKKNALDMDISTDKTLQDRDYTEDIIRKVIEVLRMCMPGYDQYDENIAYLKQYRDQDDTLWFAAINADKINWKVGYSVILMDEVQDFNACQLIMAEKLKQAGTRVIAVGDPNQAIYLFRGADADAFQKLKRIIGAGQSQQLPINFRSGGNIIDWINKNTIVNNLQAAENLKGKGKVYAYGGTDEPLFYNDFLMLIENELKNNGLLSDVTTLISRTNARLAQAAIHFIKKGINFEIVGKDMSRELAEYINRVCETKPKKVYIEDLERKSKSYISSLHALWGDKVSKQEELQNMRNYHEIVLDLIYHLSLVGFATEEIGQIRTANDLIRYVYVKLGGTDPGSTDVQKIKRNKNPRSFITLTTAHKAKGLQWGRVCVIYPEEFNPMNNKKIRTEEQKRQEENLWYVAVTRAQNSLYVPVHVEDEH